MNGNRLKSIVRPSPVRVGHLIALLAVATMLSAAAALIARELDGSRDVQLAIAVLIFLATLLSVLIREPVGFVEGLALLGTLIVLVGALVTALVLIGSVEANPPVGCVSSDGDHRATVSADNTGIFPQADHTSTPTGLLLEGCTVHYDDYCIGTVQTDAQYSGVRDSLWLKLSDDEMIANAHTVGAVPRDQPPSECPGGKPVPDELVFRGATVSRHGLIELDATAPRAAVIGFAVLRDDGRWLRLGWDISPSNSVAETFVAPAIADPTDVVFATPCMAFERPIGPTRRVRLEAGTVSGSPEPFRQPTHKDPAEAACDAGVAED